SGLAQGARRKREGRSADRQHQERVPETDGVLFGEVGAMSRDLDHVAHAVRDLDATADFYARLGFTVGARNRHAPAWGTQNHIVQLPGFFVEVLAMADTSAIVPHASHFFSFGAF